MTLDTRTEAERRYDSERDGTLYVRQPATDPMIACLDHVDRMAAEMNAAEEKIVDWILEQTEQRNINRDPVCTFTETVGPITAERWECPGTVFLEFTIGDDSPHRVLLGVMLEGHNPEPGTAEIIIDGTELDNDWTLPQLRQLRDDLDALLADERVLNAFAKRPPATDPNADEEEIIGIVTQAMGADKVKVADRILEQCEGGITVVRVDDEDCHYFDLRLGELAVEVNDNGKVSFVDANCDYLTIGEARQKALDILILTGDPRVVAAAAAEHPPA